MKKFKGFAVPDNDMDRAVKDFDGGATSWCNLTSPGDCFGVKCEDCIFCSNVGNEADKVQAFKEYAESEGYKVSRKLPIKAGDILKVRDSCRHCVWMLVISDDKAYEMWLRHDEPVIGYIRSLDHGDIDIREIYRDPDWYGLSALIGFLDGNSLAEPIWKAPKKVRRVTKQQLEKELGCELEIVED